MEPPNSHPNNKSQNNTFYTSLSAKLSHFISFIFLIIKYIECELHTFFASHRLRTIAVNTCAENGARNEIAATALKTEKVLNISIGGFLELHLCAC